MMRESDRPPHFTAVIVFMLVWQIVSPVLWFNGLFRWRMFVADQVIGAFCVWAMWRGYFWIRWFAIAGCILTLPDIRHVVQPTRLQTLAEVMSIALAVFLLYWFNTAPVRRYYRRRKASDVTAATSESISEMPLQP